MKRNKTGISLTGDLLYPLVCGRPAVIRTHRHILCTAPVVLFNARQGNTVRFETETTVYYLHLRPFPHTAICPLPTALPLCA